MTSPTPCLSVLLSFCLFFPQTPPHNLICVTTEKMPFPSLMSQPTFSSVTFFLVYIPFSYSFSSWEGQPNLFIYHHGNFLIVSYMFLGVLYKVFFSWHILPIHKIDFSSMLQDGCKITKIMSNLRLPVNLTL